MKRLCLTVLCMFLLTGCAATTPASDTKSLSLGNSWTDVFTIDVASSDGVLTLRLQDGEDSALVRIVTQDLSAILCEDVTIQSGSFYTFGDIPKGRCIIQAKSADDLPHSYTFSYTIGNP